MVSKLKALESDRRLLPPESILDEVYCYLAPANEVADWVSRCILADDGPIHNPDHSHLDQAHIGYVWASNAFTKHGRHNLDSIKSKARILIAWVDGAENVSKTAWIKLTPTVRENSSEIWITWNPEKDGSPTDDRFRKNSPPGAKIVELNYTDNPWFPEVLGQERLTDRDRLDDQTYA